MNLAIGESVWVRRRLSLGRGSSPSAQPQRSFEGRLHRHRLELADSIVEVLYGSRTLSGVMLQ
jgi:hypothetical protein